ncbi:MAG: 23S rRNA (adenine(2030)-N(6))-methyltransferase RlmJ [Geminicoccaceae bacterium]|jgi:23S rRNA (adenine2030-N6)-methyltransferase
MLSYRHAFHAGGFADVLKHAVLVHALRHGVRKPKPLYFLDTHAGAGSYDLGSAMAQKTGEYRAGIARLLAADGPAPELVAPYLELVRAANPPGVLRHYPGSPALARAVLRDQDRLELVELHGTDHGTLAGWVEGGIQVRREDGLAALVTHMPPRERRGVILIDPSYELKSDYQAVPRALARAFRRFPTGTFLLWYPVIERARTDELLATLRASGMNRQFGLELGLHPDASGRGMTAAGMVVVNPPWTLPEAAAAALPWIAGALDAEGPVSSGWIVPPL